MLDRCYRALPRPPDAYVIRSPEGDHDCAPWAALLNEDGNYGTWDADRIRREVMAELIAPDAATLVFYGEELVGCAHTCRLPTRHGKHGQGMFLYVRKPHRGRESVAAAIVWRTLWYFVREKYDSVTATTDPWRHSALFIYLREGARPIKDSLFSYWQWYRIERRLRPMLQRWRLREESMGTRPARLGA